MCVYKHWKLVHSNTALPELSNIFSKMLDLEDKRSQFLVSKQKRALRKCLYHWRSNAKQTILKDFKVTEIQVTEHFKQRKASDLTLSSLSHSTPSNSHT